MAEVGALVAEAREDSPEMEAAFDQLREAAAGSRDIACFLALGMQALEEIAIRTTRHQLRRAAAARDPLQALLLAAVTPAVLQASPESEVMNAVRRRGALAAERLLELGERPLTSQQMAEALSIGRHSVDRRRRSGRLLGVQVSSRGYLYPAWQLDLNSESGILAGLEETLQALDPLSSWTKLSFMVGQSARLGGASPVEALRQGRADEVVEAAKGFGSLAGFREEAETYLETAKSCAESI